MKFLASPCHAISSRMMANAIVCLMFWASAAGAEPIPTGCASHISAFDSDIYVKDTPFETKRHKGWYNRWWSGKCDMVPFPDRWTCARDEKKAWAAIVADLVSQARDADRLEVQRAACQLGQLIGLEWAKDNNVRCIHTSDLNSLRALLDDRAAPALERINATIAASRAKLGCRRK